MLWGSNLILLNGRWGPTVCLQRPRQRKLSQSQVVVVISTKRVSAAAVARAVGVSPATVSYALNGRAGVSRDVRVRILETAESMGHTQSSKKHQQVDKQTRVLGLVVTDIMNPFYTEIAAGVIDESRRHGYEVFLAHTQECPQMLASTVEAMIERRVDGVVLAVLHPDDGNVIRALRRAQTPFVQLSRRIEHIDADFVGIDDTAAATSIMEHVLSHGYSNIATITGPRNSSASAAREDAFAATAFVNGISPAENRRVRTYLSEEGGLRAVQELLTDGKAPQAIVCGSDAIALGVLSGLRAHRLKVPGDVSVTGFDGLSPGIAPLINLTTISQPRRRMAFSAVDLLIKRLSGVGGNAQQVVLGHELRIGTTCGCPPTLSSPSDYRPSNSLSFLAS